MRQRMLSALFVVLAACCAAPAESAELFGKNRVLWREISWTVLRSANVDYYVTLNPDSPTEMALLQSLADHVEDRNAKLSDAWRHAIEKRLVVIVTASHFEFEAIPLSGGYLPEGVGAYALPRGSLWVNNQDLVMVVKPDFLPVLNRTILTHELTHLHQFAAVGWKLFGSPVHKVDPWLWEAFAEYFAYQFDPYTRDDIRRRSQRIAAVRKGDPVFGIPTLRQLKWGQADPYGMGVLYLLYLEHVAGRERVFQLARDVFGDHENTRFVPAVADMTNGAIGTIEQLDRANRNHWEAVYASDALGRPKPYEATSSVAGTELVPNWPARTTSPRARPSGSVAYLTADNRRGLFVASTPAPPRERRPYVADPNHRKRIRPWMGYTPPAVSILTNSMPPVPYESVIGQQWNTWPFNGWDLDAYEDPAWAARVRGAATAVDACERKLDEAKAMYPRAERQQKDKKDFKARKKAYEKALESARNCRNTALGKVQKLRRESGVSRVAFFGRRNRDHALFVADGNTGKLLHTVEFGNLDQAFSPAFSSDGQTVYFSAAHRTERSLYSLELRDGAVPVRLPGAGMYRTAPAVSPDGRSIAYVAFVGDYQKLFLLDLASGVSRQLTWGAHNDNSPAFNRDGTRLAFTSDEHDGIWNLYTLELSTGVLRGWTEYYGGTYTCSFMPDEDDRVLCAVVQEDDQYRERVFPNLKLFALKLGTPLTERLMEPVQTAMRIPSASPDPPVQPLERLESVPQRWKFYGNDLYAWGSSRGGLVLAFKSDFANLVGDREHQLFAVHSRYVKVAEYRYTDLRRPTALSIGAFYTSYPLISQLWAEGGKLPKYPAPFENNSQWYLNWTQRQEYGADIGFRKPLSRFDSIVFGARIQRQEFTPPEPLRSDPGNEFPEYRVPYEQDRRLTNFFEESTGQHFIVRAGLKRDRRLFKLETFGPYHGIAANLEGEYAEPLGGRSVGFRTAKLNVRYYHALTSDVVLATRGDLFYSSRGNGSAWFVGDTDMLRRYPYLSLVCNRCAYASAEIRAPLATLVINPQYRFPIRAFAFYDFYSGGLNGEPVSVERSYGFGLHVWALVPLQFYTARISYEKRYRVGFQFGFPW